ncbi:hypothetical protein HKX48_006875 [Thoreauomyces humboldtii]|nr:hypothetical protein HKX48_006875 [Thoreauomyces humboldtii]
MSQPTPEFLKKLKAQTGAVKRIGKDLSYYDTEAAQQQERIDKLVSSGADEHDVRKQKEVLEETHQMMPDGKKRLAAAQRDLKDLLDSFLKDASPEAAASEEIVAARQLLQETTTGTA